MQTSPAALRISAVSHSQKVQMNLQAGQLVVESTALRNWQLAVAGALTTAAVLRCVLNADGELVRIRTLADNTLEITYAAPLDVMTWSSNTLTANALFGTGVDLFADGNDLDAYWFDSDGLTLKHASSADGGHSWGSAETVVTLSAQGAGVLPQLTAPYANVVVYSDSTVGQDTDGNPLTGLFVVNEVTGVWQTPVLWGLGGQRLGIETPVTLPNGQTYPSNLSSVALSDTRFELSFYSASFRDTSDAGLYIVRCANFDLAGTAQHLHWSNPETVFATVPLDADNNATQVFCTFPRLQAVNAFTWIVATEVSLYANVQKYHLAFLRSTDAKHYSDREYRQGATSAENEQVGAYVYNGGTPFLLTDLLYASIVVADARTFIVGYDKVFYCASTSYVGVTNPAKLLDVTLNTVQRNLSLPTSPSAGMGDYAIWNPANIYNNSQILSAERGIKMTHQAGYVTSEGPELVQLAVEQLDHLEQDTALPKNEFALTTIDDAAQLQRVKYDTAWEWFGSQQLAFTQFCDLSMVNVLWGNFNTNNRGRLQSGVVRPSDNFRDDMAVWQTEPAANGIAEVLFFCQGSWGGSGGNTRNHVGIVFQCSLSANDEFYAVLYNRTQGKFTLNQAVPRANPERIKLYHYRPALATSSGTITLASGTRYWLRLQEWQGHVQALYATDNDGYPNDDWTLVIDYVAPATPATSVLPSRLELFGFVGTRRVQSSNAIGQNSGASGAVDLSNGTSARYFALRVRTGAHKSTLKKIAVTLTQENPNGDPLPGVNVMLVTGDASAPDDISDGDNVVYAQDITALKFSNHHNPNWVWANTRPNPGLPRLDADTYYWIVAVLNDDLVSGQSYKYWSDASGSYGTDTTQYSDDGVTWTGLGSLNMRASIEVDYDAGWIKFVAAHLITGDEIQTQENLAHYISAKASVLDCDFDSFLTLSQMTLGPDNILWQPIEFGILNDFVIDLDVTPNGDVVQVVVAALDIDTGSDAGYLVTLDDGPQTIQFSKYGTVLGTFPTLNYIPANAYSLRVAVQQGFIVVYLNETLAGACFAGTISATTGQLLSPAGYVGLVQNAVSWDAARIPDLYHASDYFVMNANSTSMNALGDLLAKPTAGNMAQAKWFLRYNGHLRCATFQRQASSDTYVTTLIKPRKIQSAQYVISQESPQGNYYATHTDGQLLNQHGRWYDTQDITSAFDDVSAYDNANLIFRDALEKEEQYSLEVIANFATEREDKITIINPVDGTSGDYIVNDITYDIPPVNSDNPQPLMTLGLRKAVD